MSVGVMLTQPPPPIEGRNILRRGGALFPEAQYAENQCALREQKGLARGSMFHNLYLNGVLLGHEIQLPISSILEGGCRGFEGVKVGGATSEGYILEGERVFGGLGARVLPWLQEEEVGKFYHIGYRFQFLVVGGGCDGGNVAEDLEWDRFDTVGGGGVLLGLGPVLELRADV